MDYESFRNAVKFIGPQAIKDKGQIYSKDGYLFIIENGEGIHFIENYNPSNPIKKGFLKVPGCTGMAMKDHFLYVNSLIDLVIVDISNFNAPKVAQRIEGLMPEYLPTGNDQYPYAKIDKNKGVVVGWEIKEVKEEANSQPYLYNTGDVSIATAENTGGFAGSGTGVSGSITKFTIINNHLYVMEGHELYSIGIANPYSPTIGNKVFISRVVETLFPYNNHIFMGTTSGMLIYSTSNPNQPSYVAEVNHMTACDPVVVKDNYAYVTIREGRNCGGTINQLDIIDVSSMTNPILKKSYTMHNPHGLGIDQNLLFICDGSEGLKVFNASNPIESGNHLIKQFQSIKAIDVIPLNNTLIMIANDGLYQYDYTNPENIFLLSKINFN